MRERESLKERRHKEKGTEIRKDVGRKGREKSKIEAERVEEKERQYENTERKYMCGEEMSYLTQSEVTYSIHCVQ